MEHRNASSTRIARSLIFTGVTALLVAAPAVRAETTAAAAPEFHQVTLERDGRATAGELDAVTEAVRRDVQAGSKEIALLVHGFNVDAEEMNKNYTPLAHRLREEGAVTGQKTSVVGVHWAAEVSKGWLLKATTSRLASLVGAKNAVKNPYLEKAKVAKESGRQGLRALCFRLQDQFPGVPVHLFTHSMGAQVAVAALAPEAGEPDANEVEQPQRTLRVGMVMLAGADLDYNLFARNDAPERAALRRAKLWWVTTPEKNMADGVLELRRGAGKCDAVGNRGLKLEGEDLDLLVSRRALVLDEGRVPSRHAFEDYFSERRVRQLALSMLYMQSPTAPAAAGSVLARLDKVMRGEVIPGDCASIKLYAGWKRDGGTGDVRCVSLAERKGGSKVAGMRQEYRSPRPGGMATR